MKKYEVTVGIPDDGRPFWYARCDELNVVGHGDTELEAVEKCKSRMKLLLGRRQEEKTITIEM